ncbi:MULTISPECIES: 5-dehydro-4-deoxyglucarate dehydratase [Streptomyces]|uniref:5-dehydro-4-deoxyglucarate dehydratase n=1 Tax=Streptomyces TaxID=1883 RepID=UPI00136ADFBB|nr:5-dehydro-4-deoxyglucarate dehydratase [Streptomyces sp. SID2888]MYV45429.1 5-dehydro-4-deoxyglucarate dehydratase [Streptomyces sp. SID2888]
MLPHGLLSFPLTPFTPDDRVDPDAFREHLEAHLAADPAAVFVACGTGEFTALSLEEFRTVVRTAVEAVAGRVPVFAGAGGGPAQARATAAIAEECGADGLLLMPPYLVSSTPRGLLDHVRYTVSATRLPVVVYQRANAVLDPATAVALLDEPTVVGIKDGIGDVSEMLRIVTAVRSSGHPRAAEFGFLNGLPTAELSAMAYDAIGVSDYSSATLACAPDIAARFHRAYRDGDRAAMDLLLAEFYLPFAELRDLVPGYAVALIKAGARLSGIPMGRVRPPLVDAEPEHVARLEELIARGRAAVASLDAVAA